MRRKSFPLYERAVLIPLELVGAFKWFLVITATFFFAAGLGGPGGYWENCLAYGLFAVAAFAGALCAGAVLTPLLLPWLPGRAFSFKGMITGLVAVGILLLFRTGDLATPAGLLEHFAWVLLVPALSAYLAMNFTGASTYTSLSGVKKEMKRAVPLEIGAAAIGLVLWAGSRIAA